MMLGTHSTHTYTHRSGSHVSSSGRPLGAPTGRVLAASHSSHSLSSNLAALVQAREPVPDLGIKQLLLAALRAEHRGESMLLSHGEQNLTGGRSWRVDNAQMVVER